MEWWTNYICDKTLFVVLVSETVTENVSNYLSKEKQNSQNLSDASHFWTNVLINTVVYTFSKGKIENQFIFEM